MKPGSKEALAAEAAASSASGQDAGKLKLSSAKPEEVNKAAANGKPKPAGVTGRSLSWTESYYARPSDIFECFVVEGKVGNRGSK